MNKGRLIGMVVLVVMLVSGVIIWQHEKRSHPRIRLLQKNLIRNSR